MTTTLRWTQMIVIFGILMPLAAAQTYRVTDLGTFPGGTVSQGNAINDCGRVVGYARFANFNAHAFSWTKRRGLVDLAAIPPESNFSVAQAVNSFGVVAGYSTFNDPPNLDSHAVLWIDRFIDDLGTLAGSTDAQAMGINDKNEVVGFSVPHACLWTQSRGMQDLGALSGGYSQALAINSKGDIVGFSNSADQNWHAVLWTKAKGLQALPYLVSSDVSASANAINRHGDIAGGVSGDFKEEFAVMWERNGNITNLGVLPGQGWSTAFAINDHKEIVGWSGFHAFIWTRENGMQDLNTLIPSDSGWSLSLPTGINNRGQITGQGSINGQQHAFLLTPSDGAADDDCE
jgi:probable HAF family extracellular repeat protein